MGVEGSFLLRWHTTEDWESDRSPWMFWERRYGIKRGKKAVVVSKPSENPIVKGRKKENDQGSHLDLWRTEDIFPAVIRRLLCSFLAAIKWPWEWECTVGLCSSFQSQLHPSRLYTGTLTHSCTTVKHLFITVSLSVCVCVMDRDLYIQALVFVVCVWRGW